MLYYLFTYLDKKFDIPGAGVFQYISFRAGVAAVSSVYVGDDARDIEAGRRAGTMTVAAGWGYLDGEDSLTWGADCVAATPVALLSVLGLG